MEREDPSRQEPLGSGNSKALGSDLPGLGKGEGASSLTEEGPRVPLPDPFHRIAYALSQIADACNQLQEENLKLKDQLARDEEEDLEC